MKKSVLTLLFITLGFIASNATVLFPHFVDIAPNYEKGDTETLIMNGITNLMYHSTTPGFLTSKFSEVESFFEDTLPSDVTKEEKNTPAGKLLIYYSLHKKDDTIKTPDTRYTIYVLQLPDDAFVAGYAEEEMKTD